MVELSLTEDHLVHNPQNSIIIELHDDRFDELVVEVDDPRVAVEQINARLQ